MKRLSITASRLCLVIIVFYCSSCKKIIDRYFPSHPDPDPVTVCKISTITQASLTEDGVPTRDGRFYYNDDDDLDSIIFDDVNFSDRQIVRWVFHYSSPHHIESIDGVGASAEINARSINMTFSYMSGRITKQFTHTAEIGLERDISDSIIYDTQGRVVAEYILTVEGPKYPGLFTDTVLYTYNADGNLAYSPYGSRPLVYDNKVNFLQTDSLLMLLSKNYSRNNIVGATSYTEGGLPRAFQYVPGEPLPFMFFGSDKVTAITYSCAAVQ